MNLKLKIKWTCVVCGLDETSKRNAVCVPLAGPVDMMLCEEHAREVEEGRRMELLGLAAIVNRAMAPLVEILPREPFDVRCADALADEVDFLVQNKLISSRSPAADALLDYRNPPSTPRSDRIAELEKRGDELRAAIAKISQENPFPEEVRNWTDQRAKLIAEVGMLRADLEEAKTVNRVLKGDLEHFRGENKRLTEAHVKKNGTINALRHELGERTESNLQLREDKDAAYRERNQLVAALARFAASCRDDKINHPQSFQWDALLGRHQPDPDPNWDPRWLTVVFVYTPHGQLSWHIHDDDRPMFEGLDQRHDATWDGHTTEEKYERLARLFR